ncbi:Copper amine oxidase N-terminal domain-containing protein [Paenibacillus sp. UNCCL117]|uniref:stalk domain-containing protein n=1 Tax=unclassified Paenibacillus TaxID=185978 RepID=UPI00088540CF|nr:MULTISPECIES: stalk domain-containing protein [unclassified Paenibacillus]SDC51643.1 Copper amine oxidase N-terminal domain-containing protein [Paenibacillus sp. cl123]SFW11427.1 Copper amine oxidase N-terminal domain-containing protein [Paenibacillus sp. UNCCL117]
MFVVKPWFIRKALSLVVAGEIVCSASACGFVAGAQAGSTIDVYFQGEKLQFNNAEPLIKNGSTLVPFRKLFETLGYTVTWESSSERAIGTKDGLVIELTINSTSAKVNQKAVTLSEPAQIIEGNTMVPLRFVAENSGYQVSFDSNNGVSTIRIGESGGTPDAPDSLSDNIEPYVVKGYIRDAEGNPIAGATVYADNTLLYDSNIIGASDETGYYRLQLPELASTWRIGATFTKVVNGKSTEFQVFADKDEPFSGNTGAIRHITWKNGDGYIYLYPDIFSFREDLPQFDMLDVKVTLTPVGGGTPITRMVDYVNDSVGLEQLPMGKFTASAIWLPAGHDPIPLLIRLENKGEFAESVQFEFGSSVNGPDSLKFMREFEVRIPAKAD